MSATRSLVKPVLYFGALFLVTNFVNKYVLSVLEFKYPTVFQGWQTLVGFIVLRMLVVSKHLPPLLTDSTRSDLIGWIPGMILFAASVYSGSKGLANLPIPSFFALQSLVTVMSYGFNVIANQMLTSFFSYLMMMLIVVSSVLIIHSDPQFHPEGYIWTGIHVLVTGLLQISTKLTKGRLNINATEKLYCNYMYSVVIFAPSSYLLGDALEATNFPYLYFSKFWCGCILSGIFGVFLNLQSVKLQETDIDSLDFAKVIGGAKITTSLLSYFFFDAFYTANYAMWISVNLLACLVVEDPDQVSGRTPSLTIPDMELSTDQELVMSPKSKTADLNNSWSGAFPTRHNVLYNDYLRDSNNSDAEDSEVYEINRYHV